MYVDPVKPSLCVFAGWVRLYITGGNDMIAASKMDNNKRHKKKRSWEWEIYIYFYNSVYSEVDVK